MQGDHTLSARAYGCAFTPALLSVHPQPSSLSAGADFVFFMGLDGITADAEGDEMSLSRPVLLPLAFPTHHQAA